MTRFHRGVIVWTVAALMAVPATDAFAQRRREQRQPHAGSSAVGADIGVFLPDDERFDPAPPASAYYEY